MFQHVKWLEESAATALVLMEIAIDGAASPTTTEDNRMQDTKHLEIIAALQRMQLHSTADSRVQCQVMGFAMALPYARRFAATMALLVVQASAAREAKFVSVLGDPGMRSLKPRFLLEGWNFCNRAGRACQISPRWADCISPSGTQLVTPADNAAGLLQPDRNASSCDAATEQKERDLGSLCEQPTPANASESSYFWTLMLKSGAMNSSEGGHLCGLWCDKLTPSCNRDVPHWKNTSTSVLPWLDNNYAMRQPRVKHVWSAPQDKAAGGGFSGSFYGTYDPMANIEILPTPDAIADATNAASDISSYFGFEWIVRDGRQIFRHVLRTGHDLNWIMLYTGAEGSGAGGKGGYPWDARGMYSPAPVSTTLNSSEWAAFDPPPTVSRPPNNFIVEMWTNISSWPGGPGFYFLNHGACWKDSGEQCEPGGRDADKGNSTDVTRFVLAQSDERVHMTASRVL